MADAVRRHFDAAPQSRDRYQREVAFPYTYSATSPMVTVVEKIKMIRSQSGRFSLLLSVRIEKRAFSANLRIGLPNPDFARVVNPTA
jgi:hypothetical protein